MTSLTVTATQGGSGNTNGIVLDVRVVTGAAAVQNGKTGSSATITTPQLAITPNATGSWVYVSIDAFGNASTLTANAATTLRENVDQSGNPTTYGTGRTTSTTTAATPVTVGASAPTGYSADAVQLALAEILAAPGATLAEDASTPAVAYTTAAETVTTGSFSPPPGSLLVAIVAPNSTGAAGIQTITVSDSSGLTWTPLVVISSSGDSANGIWVAVVPPAPAVIPALPGPAWRHRFQHRQVPGLPPPVPPASGPLLYPLQQPAGLAQRAPGPFRAGRAQGRQGTFSGQGPRLTPLQQPVASRGSAPGPQRYGRAAGNAGAPPPAIPPGYRLFPSTYGPGSSVSYGGVIVQGILFEVTDPGMVLRGYWFWRADSPQSASASFALWQATGFGTGTLISNSSASTSTMVAGQWNYVPLPGSLALTSGTAYKAVVGVSGNFNDTTGQFDTGGPYVGGITNGPLTAFSAVAGTGGTLPDVYGDYQCTYDTSTSDPTAVYPASDSSSYNAWIDVQVDFAATPGPPLYPLRRPVAARLPAPFIRGTARNSRGVFSGQGPRLTPLQQPAGNRGHTPGPQRTGRAAGNAGTYAPPPPTSGPPLTPLQQPCGNRGRMPGPARYGRVQGISGGTFSGHGPAVTPLQCPAGIGYRAPGPARTGRAQGSPGAPYTATPPQAAPPQAQPGQTWLRQHRRHQLPMLPPPGTAGPRLYPLQQPVGQNVRCTIRPFFRGGTGHATPLPPKPLAGVFLTWLF
jgi:hypothetical protein